MKKVRKVADLADLARAGKEHKLHVIFVGKKQLVLVIWVISVVAQKRGFPLSRQ